MIESNLPRLPCEDPKHDQAILIMFTGPRGNEREIKQLLKSISECGRCQKSGFRPLVFIFGERAAETNINL